MTSTPDMVLYVSTPVHGWSVSGAYMATMQGLASSGIPVMIRPKFGMSDLVWARNVAAHEFLQTDATHLLTFDADQGCDWQDLLALARFPGLSACAVRKKNDSLTPDKAFNFVCEEGDPVLAGDFMRVELIGAGCTCVPRECMMRVVYESRYYMCGGQPVPDVYGHLYTEASEAFPERLSEDYSFCLRARRLGWPAWLYVPGQILHLGEKVWKTNLEVRK